MTCLSCGRRQLRSIRRYRAHTKSGRALFARSSLWECTSCGLVQSQPPPDSASLDAYYADAYWESAHPGVDLTDPAQFPRDNLALFNRGQSIAELIQREPGFGPKRILDIGAGYGHVLYALGERYPDASLVAVEASEQCRAHLQSMRVDVFTEPVDRFISLTDRKFDVIVLSHTLEHFLHPTAILESLRSLMNPHGVLCVEVPNLPVELHGEPPAHRWVPRYDEPHIVFFSTAVLAKLISGLGYRVLVCDTVGPRYTTGITVHSGTAALRATLHRILPRRLLLRIRKQRVGLAARDDSFYEYGGSRIWIRCLAKRGDDAATPAARPRPSEH